MPDKNSSNRINDEDQYEELRDQGMSKEKAEEVGIKGRSQMDKDELIDALRDRN